MSMRKSVQQIWHSRESGLFVPEGTVSDLSRYSSQTFLQIKEKALAIERVYADSDIPLPPTCGLASLISEAKANSNSWLLNQSEGDSWTRFFHAMHLDRIADAILALHRLPDRNKYLTSLTSGNLDLLERQQSNAKDVLWELELWSMLNSMSFNAILSEPPDIVVVFEDAKIGIACKKLYSEKNVEKVLSEGVAQIKDSFDFGIIAVNIDDLVPPNQIMQFPNQETMGKCIMNFNLNFLKFHKRHFRKYLASGRLLAALVSTSGIADVSDGRTRLTNAQQATMWAIPGLPLEKKRQFTRFYDQLMGR